VRIWVRIWGSGAQADHAVERAGQSRDEFFGRQAAVGAIPGVHEADRAAHGLGGDGGILEIEAALAPACFHQGRQVGVEIVGEAAQLGAKLGPQ
jgi:hypothetical protein